MYFHGGGFSAGSGSLAALSDKWAREEDIVVVGVNHRLNVFGYLYLGMLDEDYADSGNAGIYDLILSLEWIRDNITAFGGDPDNVTIMGESGGCMKVNTLMSMPEARGLFRRAICESGSMPVNENTPEMAAECTLALLRELGLKKEEWRKLLEISPQDLTAAMQKAQLPGLGFRPVADGRAFSPSKSTSGSYALPEFAKEIPLMIGCSEDENATMLLPEIGSLTKENMAEKILESSTGWLTAGPVNEDNVHTLIAQTDKVKAGESLYQKLARNVSLGGKLCRDSYREAVAKAKEGGPVYHYLVTYDSPIPWMKDVRVAYHTADLPLQFRVVYFNECESLSKIIAHNFAAFIRTGDPSTENLTWPMFTLDGRETMVFDKECRVESDPLREVWDILGQK